MLATFLLVAMTANGQLMWQQMEPNSNQATALSVCEIAADRIEHTLPAVSAFCVFMGYTPDGNVWTPN